MTSKNTRARAGRRGVEDAVTTLRKELDAAKTDAVAERKAWETKLAAHDIAMEHKNAARRWRRSSTAEREKRVEDMRQKAARRMGNAGVLRGWTAWQELYDEQVAQRQMLASAGARLLRPKLAASIAHWRAHWEAAARGGVSVESCPFRRRRESRVCCKHNWKACARRWRLRCAFSRPRPRGASGASRRGDHNGAAGRCQHRSPVAEVAAASGRMHAGLAEPRGAAARGAKEP